MLEGVIIYKIDKCFLELQGKTLSDLMQKWLDSRELNTIVSYTTFTDEGELIVDCFQNQNIEKDAKKYSEMLLKKLKINYTT